MCVDGECVPDTDPTVCDPECTGGNVCVDGECVPDTDPDVCDPECTGGNICVDGECVPDTETDACGGCTGRLICLEVDVGDGLVNACVGADVCVPDVIDSCPEGTTCRFAVGSDTLVACVEDDGTTGPPISTDCTTEGCDVGVCANVDLTALGGLSGFACVDTSNTCDPTDLLPCGSATLACVEVLGQDICVSLNILGSILN